MAAREIEKSVARAREFAALSDYDAALMFYHGLDRELETQAGISTGLMKSRWEALRDELAVEAQLVKDLQSELKLYISPADAARVDQPRAVRRVNSTGHNDDTNIQVYDSRPIRRAEPPPVGIVNHGLYGDPDKFGPDLGAHPAPERGRWGGGGGDYGRNPAPQPVRRTNSSGPSSGVQHQAPSSVPQAPLQRVDSKPKVKPPLPQAAKGGAGKVTGAKGPVKGGVDVNGKTPFVPRAGDEDLVASIQADIFVGNLKVKWDDVAGLGEAKESLKEAMVLPMLLPEFFQGCRQPHKGILLYGPPGTGKTMLAKAASTQCETTFFNVSPTTLASKWRGDSERLVRVLFEMARHYAPSTIFVDEIDALTSQRGTGEHEATRRMKTEFLTQVDGMASAGDGKGLVIVLGATNLPWEIDDGFLRRLSKRIYIPLPDQSSRVELLTITTKGILLGEDVNFDEIARAMENYSGSDIASICKEASLMALRKGMGGLQVEDIKKRANEIQKELCSRPLCRQDFFDAMRRVRSSTNQTLIGKYEKWTEEFGCL